MSSIVEKYSSPSWADVPRVVQDDSSGVCAIGYSPGYVVLMDVFRGVVRSADVSPRVLSLLTDLITHNPANYTVWHYRRIVLAALAEAAASPAAARELYAEELAFVADVAEAHPKNYQIWYHRQVVVGLLVPADDRAGAQAELDFIARIFEDDSKNYHAWAYRQWVLTRYAVWDTEADFVDALLLRDVRNNSAWNQRHFVFSKGPRTFANDPAVLTQEVQYVMGKISKAPNNESAWNYLRGILGDSYKAHPEVKAFCVDLRSRGVVSPYLLATLADIHAEEGGKAEATELFDLLEKKVDTVHRKYWEHRKAQLA